MLLYNEEHFDQIDHIYSHLRLYSVEVEFHQHCHELRHNVELFARTNHFYCSHLIDSMLIDRIL